MTKSNHAVHIWEVFEALWRKPISNLIHDRCRTIYGRQYTNKIPSTDTTISAHISLKCCSFIFWNHFDGFKFASVGIITIKFTKLRVMAMNHITRFNIRISKTNSDCILKNWLTLENFSGSNLVTGRYLAFTGHIFTGNISANRHINSCNNNIIVWVQANNGTT